MGILHGVSAVFKCNERSKKIQSISINSKIDAINVEALYERLSNSVKAPGMNKSAIALSERTH